MKIVSGKHLSGNEMKLAEIVQFIYLCHDEKH